MLHHSALYLLSFYFLLQIYRILGKTVVCYPIIFDLSDFYMSQDVLLLIDDIKVLWGEMAVFALTCVRCC